MFRDAYTAVGNTRPIIMLRAYARFETSCETPNGRIYEL
jgi:hypothetical protein